MAKFTFNMPDVGEGVAEAEIVEWHVKVGDRVEEDQHLVDVMTDKATIDIESPVSGVVTQLAGEVGDTIAIGAMLLVIETEGEVSEAEAEAAAEQVEDEMSDAPTSEEVAERIEVETSDASDADDAIAAAPAPRPHRQQSTKLKPRFWRAPPSACARRISGSISRR